MATNRNTRTMTVREWIAVPDCPIQRDTERHAARATHLMTPLSIHSIVYAAELPDKSLVKLDGHTRALLWKKNQVKHPAEITVILLPVKDMEEVKQLYQTLDSKDALETQRDKVSGAFGNLGFSPDSPLLQRGSITTALRMSYVAMMGGNVQDAGYRRKVSAAKGTTKGMPDIYVLIYEFQNELFALDSFGANHIPSGVITAFILTYRKYGKRIAPFWTALFGNGGEKMGGKMDAVQALAELMLQRKGRTAGSSATYDLASRAVNAAEKWLENEYFSSIPRPIDITNYIANVKPSEVLLKKGTTDHDKVLSIITA